MMKKNIKHIVFGDFSKNTLLRNEELKIDTKNIICLNDDLRVGPIYKLNTELGKTKRLNWLKSVLKDTFNENYIIAQVLDDISKIEYLKQNINDIEELYIWTGKNVLDKLCASRLLYELQNLNTTCYHSDFSNIKLETLRGTYFSPKSLYLVRPEQVHHLTKSFRRIEKNEYIIWKDLWEKTINTKEIFRFLLYDGTIKSEDEDYFDTILKSNCSFEFNRVVRIIGKTLDDINFETSDWILNWRLKKLVEMKKIKAKGELKDIKDFSVKLATKNKDA